MKTNRMFIPLRIKIFRGFFIILTIVFALFPFYIMFKSSFQPFSEIMSVELKLWPSNWFNTDNFKQLMDSQPILHWLFNSLFIALVAIFFNLVFDVTAAFALSRLNFKGRDILFFLFICTLMIPIQIIIVPLYILMTKFGWVNNYWGLIIPNLVSPFSIFFLRQHFIMLPMELDEAAILDGSGYLTILFRIIIPNSLAAIGTIAVIKFMWIWGDYLWPSLIIKSENLRTLPVGIALLESPSGTIPWDMVMPASVIAVVPILVLFLFLQKFFITGLTEGAIKG